MSKRGIMDPSHTKQLVDMLAQSYEETTSIIKADSKNQLNRSVIADTVEKLRALIFPGYFGKKKISGGWLKYYVGALLEDITYHLEAQIELALTHRGEALVAERAAEITFAFLSKLPDIRALLVTDVEATFDGDPAAFSRDEIISSYPGIFAITTYRLAHELYLLDVPLIPRIMSEHSHSITGVDIHPGATIGKYFFIDHGTGIVIGETTVIGDYVKIYQGVTLGALSTRGGQQLKSVKRHPTLCSHVTVYSGASIFGGATVIGEGTVIGSSAFIVKSVPDQTRVSVKNVEHQFKPAEPEKRAESHEEGFWDWVI